MLLYFAILLTVAMVEGFGNDVCTENDDACVFYLTVSERMKMWRGFQERVYINHTDCKPYIYGSSDTVNPDDVILADGFENLRTLTVVNGTMPGPTLTMYVNQNITVHVTNTMLSGNVAIHWHGLTMKNTPWMDGAAFITQCPVLPGQSFTYNFIADQVGTHFYHAHSDGRNANGLFGPLIVKPKVGNVYEEHVMTIQDFNNRKDTSELVFESIYGVVNDNGEKFGGHPLEDGTQTTVVDVTSSLINGRGRLYDENGNQLTCTPLSVFEVQQGKTYRFRIINAAYGFQSIFSIDDHHLAVMSLDGHDTVPVSVDKVMSHSGERFDFILTANQSVGNYWVRMDSVVTGRYPAFAILRYSGAPDVEPQTAAQECTAQSPCTYLNCPFTSKSHMTCINVDALKSVEPTVSAPAASGVRFKEYFINFGFMLYKGAFVGHANGMSMVPATVSALTQPHQVDKKCSDDPECGVEKACRCTGSMDIQLGDVIQLNLLNLGFTSIVHHPIHTHGYNFHVLKIGYRPTNDSFADFGPTPDVTCNTDSVFAVCNNASWTNSTWAGGNIPGIDLQRAPLKDTLTVPAGGYAVVRFVVDNPGLWLVHCHQAMHVSVFGMGILLNDSFADIPPPPPGFPTCSSFEPRYEEPPTSASTSTSTSTVTTLSTTDCDDGDKMFTKAEFWGTTGGLLFVVLLQFIIAVSCLSRRGSKYTM